MKKTFLTLAAVIAAFPVAFAADQFSVFKICEDKHVIKTSDGQECGHIEYIVADPAHQRIVTAVVSGGILSDRLVAVPFEDFRYGAGADITVNIDRQRLVSAPVIERQTLVSGGFIEPTVVQRSVSYFGGGASIEGRAATSTAVTGAEGRNETVGQTNRSAESINDPNMRANGAATRNGQPAAATDTSRETAPTRNGSNSNAANVTEPNTRNSSSASHSSEKQPSNGTHSTEGESSRPSSRSNERTSTPEKNAGENPRTTPETSREKTSGATKAEEQKSLNQAEEKAAKNSKSSETDRDTERATRSGRTGSETSTEPSGSESHRDPSANTHEKSSSSRSPTPASETSKSPASPDKGEAGEKRL